MVPLRESEEKRNFICTLKNFLERKILVSLWQISIEMEIETYVSWYFSVSREVLDINSVFDGNLINYDKDWFYEFNGTIT